MIRFICLLIALLLSLPASAAIDTSTFAQIPILHEGRVKPLDTYARVYLKTFSGKESVENLEAIDWLAELIFTPEKSWERPIIRIDNPDVVEALNLDWRENKLFTFYETVTATKAQRELINQLLDTPAENRTHTQDQLLDVYYKTLWVFSMSRSISLVWPYFYIENETLAQQIGAPVSQTFSYLEMLVYQDDFLKLVDKLDTSNTQTEAEISLLQLGERIKELTQSSIGQVFPIIPPQTEESAEWVSPWQLVQEGHMTQQAASYLMTLEAVSNAFIQNDNQAFNTYTQQALNIVTEHTYQTSVLLLSLEVAYNNLNLFFVSIIVYGLSLLMAMWYLFKGKDIIRKFAFITLTGGALLHAAGIILRILIMNRPPVATLYESILFSCLVMIILSLIIEAIRKDGLALFAGALGGVFLQFLGLKFSGEGDTMGMLAAVLNTNFWLATHVVTITIGYGCAIVASILGHIYLVKHITGMKPSTDSSLIKTIIAVSLVALFFTALGTILGGIWADQSWGRFWGWDPKENGALLIVLWLATIIHGRIDGILNKTHFAAGIALTNVVVALAWFGVNLLNVGLHSYGFTDSLALNLYIFCGIEFAFVSTLIGYIWSKKHAY